VLATVSPLTPDFALENDVTTSAPEVKSDLTLTREPGANLVVVRGTLIQLATPDEMRGRVNAVDMIFIGASNQLGQFESGVTAQWFGAVPAVILGGVGTLVVTALWAWGFPELRNADQLVASKI